MARNSVQPEGWQRWRRAISSSEIQPPRDARVSHAETTRRGAHANGLTLHDYCESTYAVEPEYVPTASCQRATTV